MNKDFWKTLYCWLETASLEEITAKQLVVRHLLGESNDPGLKTDSPDLALNGRGVCRPRGSSERQPAIHGRISGISSR